MLTYAFPKCIYVLCFMFLCCISPIKTNAECSYWFYVFTSTLVICLSCSYAVYVLMVILCSVLILLDLLESSILLPFTYIALTQAFLMLL